MGCKELNLGIVRIRWLPQRKPTIRYYKYKLQLNREANPLLFMDSLLL